jgi:hypothetical protein
MYKFTKIKIDKQNSPPIRIKAYLLADNALPILIGYEDVLTELRLVSNYTLKRAYVEFR